jgi:hypothetical protein
VSAVISVSPIETAVQWLYAITAASFIVGGAAVAAFLGTAVGVIVGAALIAAGVAFVIFAMF